MEQVQVAAPAGSERSETGGTLYRAKPHPLALLPPGVALAIAITLAIVAGSHVSQFIGMLGFRAESGAAFASACRWFLIIVPTIVGINLLASCLELLTTVYAVTGSKATMRSGVLRVTTATVYLEKVESMVREQGPIERLFDTGSVTLVGTGGGRDTLTHVRHLSRFLAALERSLPRDR